MVIPAEQSEGQGAEASAAAAENMQLVTPAELRDDIRAMERAAKRIAQFREWDEEETDGTGTLNTRTNTKKSGSLMVAADKVKDTIDWPHMHIQRVSGGKRVGVQYKELTIAEFVFGFLEMLDAPKAKWDREVMLGILMFIMRDAIDFSWENARGFYQMVGIDVECGMRSWDDTDGIQSQRLLHSRTVLPEKKETKEVKKEANNNRTSSQNLRCCALYQKKACEQNRDHAPFSHACSYCARATGVAYRHPEDDCFRKTIDDSKNSKPRE